MNNRNKKTVFLTLFSLLSPLITSLFFSLIIFNNQPLFPKKTSNQEKIKGAQTSITSPLIRVSASIGEFHFSLYGYSSPQALITFQGLGIFDQTYADKKGFFQFKNRFSPFSPREACLTAQDQFGRLTSPVCLPPFPTNYNLSIGPVIIPPTISLDKGEYWVGDEVILSGQTIPNTQVNLSLFTEKRGLGLAHLLIPSVYAFSLPQLKTRSDDKGNFSISLPSATARKFRFFTTTSFKNQSSPKSLVLHLNVLPKWMLIIKFFLAVWLVLKSRLLEVIILLEIALLVLFFYRGYFHPQSIKKNKQSRLIKT